MPFHETEAKKEILELLSRAEEPGEFLRFLQYCADNLRRNNSVQAIWKSYHPRHDTGK